MPALYPLTRLDTPSSSSPPPMHESVAERLRGNPRKRRKVMTHRVVIKNQSLNWIIPQVNELCATDDVLARMAAQISGVGGEPMNIYEGRQYRTPVVDAIPAGDRDYPQLQRVMNRTVERFKLGIETHIENFLADEWAKGLADSSDAEIYECNDYGRKEVGLRSRRMLWPKVVVKGPSFLLVKTVKGGGGLVNEKLMFNLSGKDAAGLGMARLINHSCLPNVEWTTRSMLGDPRFGANKSFRVAELTALRQINSGDILTVRYGDDYFGDDNEDCLCEHIHLHPTRNAIKPDIRFPTPESIVNEPPSTLKTLAPETDAINIDIELDIAHVTTSQNLDRHTSSQQVDKETSHPKTGPRLFIDLTGDTEDEVDDDIEFVMQRQVTFYPVNQMEGGIGMVEWKEDEEEIEFISIGSSNPRRVKSEAEDDGFEIISIGKKVIIEGSKVEAKDEAITKEEMKEEEKLDGLVERGPGKDGLEHQGSDEDDCIVFIGSNCVF